MGLVEWIGNLGWSALGYIVPFLFVLTLVVFFHELGHFLVARWTGVAVKTFSIGFGPELFGFNDRKGTRWKISAIPLGGYVRFLGDENEASVAGPRRIEADGPGRARTLLRRQGRRRPGGHRRRRPDRQFRPGDRHLHGDLQHLRPRGDDPAGRFGGARLAGGGGRLPARRRGRIDRRQRRSSSFTDLQRIVSLSADTTLCVVVRRGDQDVTLSVTPEAHRNRGFRPQTADGHARRQPQPPPAPG